MSRLSTLCVALPAGLAAAVLAGLHPPARAALPLVLVADVADLGLRAWWRPGELVLGKPDEAGRPGLRPLVSLAPVVLPVDLESWAALGEACVSRPESRAREDGARLRAQVLASAEGPVIQLLDGQELLATNALGRPAQVCDLLLAEADAMPGLEVIVSWRLELGGERPAEGGGAELRGYTVYRVPETAR